MGKIKSILAALVLFSVPAIWSVVAQAAGNFGLESVTVLDKSINVVADTPTVSGNTVTSTIVFHELNDYVKYNLALKNSTTTSYKIIDITDNNSNTLIDYTYDNHADEVINAGVSLNLELTITYVQAHQDANDRTQNNNVKFTISYLDLHTSTVEDDEIILVPNTGENTKEIVASNFVPGIVTFAIIFAGIVLVAAILYKKKGIAIISVLAIVITTTGVLNMGAVAEDYSDIDIELNSEIKLRDQICGELYWKDPDTGADIYMSPDDFGCDDYDPDNLVYFGDLFNPSWIPAPDGLMVTGFKFTGTNTDVNLDAPILDDYSVTLLYGERTYSITYDYNGGTVATANPTTIKKTDQAFTLNKPTKDTAYFNCWTGTDIYGCQENVTIEPTSVYSDLEFTATYKHEVVVKDQNGTELDRTFVNEGSDGYYESVDYHTDEFKITGGSCTNGQHIITTNNSYEVENITSNTVCTIATAPITYDVELIVNHGSGDGLVTVNKGANATFENIVADDLYTLPTGVNCTNGQNATISNGTVIVSNVTNNTTCTVNALPPSLHTITYMQEMTPEICAATTTPSSSFETANHDDWDGSHFGDENYIPRTVLVDTRDQQKYLVAKLADGECWMTQNLNLTMSTTKALTKEETDLHTKDSYTPDRNTLPSMPTTGSPYGDFATVSDMQLSWHANNKYYVDTEKYPGMGVKASEAPTSDSDEYLWQQTGIFYTGYVLSAGTYPYNGGSGVYYTDTICPKGWTLPEGRFSAEEGHLSKSFDKLYTTYAPGRTQQEYIDFNKTTIFRPVYAGYYRAYGSVLYSGSSDIMMLSSNYISPYNGQHNRISVLKASYTTFTPTYVASDISAFGAYGLNARCIAR